MIISKVGVIPDIKSRKRYNNSFKGVNTEINQLRNVCDVKVAKSGSEKWVVRKGAHFFNNLEVPENVKLIIPKGTAIIIERSTKLKNAVVSGALRVLGKGEFTAKDTNFTQSSILTMDKDAIGIISGSGTQIGGTVKGLVALSLEPNNTVEFLRGARLSNETAESNSSRLLKLERLGMFERIG